MHRHLNHNILYSILAIASFFSCNSSAPKEKDITTEVKTVETIDTEEIIEADSIPNDTLSDSLIELPPIPLKDDYNDIALFLSGKKLDKKSPYYELTKDSSFIKYSKSISYNYKKYNDKQLVKISDWSEKTLKTIHESSKDIFYPFSGPDIVHAITVFPKGENYYLYGLEPVGEI